MRFAVDTGGTFTDLVVEDDDGLLHIYKAPTTPEDPVAGVLHAFEQAAAERGADARSLLARGDLFIHGTTIAMNAVLTGRTARTAFLTTRGHPDILVFREAGRMGLPMFDYGVPYPEPYVPRALTFEVPERIGADGRVLWPLDDAAVLALVPALAAAGVEAVAVCLLWSIVNPRHERRIGDLLAEHLPGVVVSLSHALNPSIREYRRASSTCIDASLKPLMGAYLSGMSERLAGRGLRRRRDGRDLPGRRDGGRATSRARRSTPSSRARRWRRWRGARTPWRRAAATPRSSPTPAARATT